MKRISVNYMWEPESWSADSPDAPGFVAVANTLDELRELVAEGLQVHLGRSDIEIVEISPTMVDLPLVSSSGNETTVRFHITGDTQKTSTPVAELV
jgi:predicted RNase H-like HicB family nuclease